MLIILNWIDLNQSLQRNIINKMLKSFNKSIKCELELFFYTNINNRFSKKSCKVLLYYEEQILEGICIYWTDSTYHFIYLDKFFSVNLKPGIGKTMLNLFISTIHNDRSDNKNLNSILWRTTPAISLFYLKHPSVVKYFNFIFNKNKNKNIVYMGIGKRIWEYEDIYNLKIISCFQVE